MRRLLLLAVCQVLLACGSPEAPHAASGLYGGADELEAGALFPKTPDAAMTPGETCANPDSYRHPANIPYCERDVSSSTKKLIIDQYDETRGFKIRTMNRGDFKIDHFVPLCIGGSNSVKNLWPQHKSIYVHTDPVEHKTCELMALGKIKQADAIALVRKAKLDVAKAKAIVEDLDGRLAAAR